MGRDRFRTNPALVRELQDQLGILVVQTSLCVIYPGLGAVYYALPVDQQPFFTIVFPIAKVLLSNAVALASRNLTESVPDVAPMPVEVFNALYLVKCMQKAGSNMTVFAILAFDLFESVMAFRDIRSQTEQLSRQICKTHNQSLPQRILKLCLEPGVFHSRPCSLIRLRSHLRMNRSMKLNAILTRLEPIGQTRMGPSVETITNTAMAAVPATRKQAQLQFFQLQPNLGIAAQILPMQEPQVLP